VFDGRIGVVKGDLLNQTELGRPSIPPEMPLKARILTACTRCGRIIFTARHGDRLHTLQEGA
jgi:hypothetical protein